jgi:hypothetical protein
MRCKSSRIFPLLQRGMKGDFKAKWIHRINLPSPLFSKEGFSNPNFFVADPEVIKGFVLLWYSQWISRC